MLDPAKMFRLDDRVALVTGGAGLLGVEFCRTLAAAGAAVVVADINDAKATSVVADLSQNGLKATSFALDVTDTDSVNALEAYIEKEFRTT